MRRAERPLEPLGPGGRVLLQVVEVSRPEDAVQPELIVVGVARVDRLLHLLGSGARRLKDVPEGIV